MNTQFKTGDKAVIPVKVTQLHRNYADVQFPNGDIICVGTSNLTPCFDAIQDPIAKRIDEAANIVGITDEERPIYEKLVYDYINLKRFTYQESINAALREIVLKIQNN